MSVVRLDTRALHDRTLRARIDALLVPLGQGFNPWLERETRLAEVRRLDALGDEALARLGLTRDRIVAHVFRDILDL